MRVRHHLLPRRSFTCLASPVLSEGNKELLVAGEAILRGSDLSRKGLVVAIVGSGETRDIRDVFPKRLFAVHGHIGERLVGVILRGKSRGGCVEMREVRARPPIAHAAFEVKRAAFCVKRMTDFVSDDSTDGAIVGRGWCLRIKERRLKDGGGAIGRVLQRKIDCVYGLGRR